VCVCDYTFKEIGRLPWINGLLTKVSLPALEASSNDAAQIRVTVQPEQPSEQGLPGNGSTFRPTPQGVMEALQPPVRKPWLSSAYCLKIDGLDDACQRVTKIEAMTLGVRELPNLVVTLPQLYADRFTHWFQSANDREGSLSYLTSDAKAGAKA